MRQIHKALLMLKMIGEEHSSTSDIERSLHIHRNSVTRYVRELRNMGATLTVRKYTDDGVWRWDCDNWDQIRSTVYKWIDLEDNRDLRPESDRLE